MRNERQYDRMMNTPVPRLILTLSVPTVISMMVTNIYNLVDTAFVGKLGTSASGAVGIVFGFMSILQAIGFLFGQGSGSIISRSLGAKDEEKASDVASTGFFYAFALGLIASLICLLFLDPLVRLLGSTETIAPYAKTYITYILLTAPCMVSGFTMNNILRYEGKAFLGMIGLLSGAILNIAGDMFFMFVLHMGIAGAGLSTALSQLISFLILLSEFLRGKTQCKLSLRRVSRDFSRVFDICSTGFPSLIRQGLNSVSTIVLNMEAALYGDAAVAAMSIVARIFFFIFSVAVGIGQGFQPVSGFSYGAKKYDRLKKAFLFTAGFSDAMMLVLGSIVFWKAGMLVGMLREDPAVIEIGTRALQLECLTVLFLPPCMVTEMLMQSTGKKVPATLLSSLRSGVVLIPVLLIMSSWRGLAGIQEAQPIAFVISSLPAVWFALRFFKNLEMQRG